MIVRKASVVDADAILSCLAEAFAPFREQYTEGGFKDTVLDPDSIRARFEVMTILVCEREDEVVGTIAAQATGDGEGHLRGMAVRREAQGSNAARLLLRAAEMELADRGCARVTLDTTEPLQRAIRFYEKNGYRRTGRVADFFGMPLFEFAKELQERRDISFRPAAEQDLETIVALLANDPLGSGREVLAAQLPESYRTAFRAIAGDPNNELIVADEQGSCVGVLQLTFIPGLTYQGGWRAQIEGVRVAAELRGRGVGAAMIEDAIRRARERGCRLVQLTSDKSRPDALRFYQSLGFEATHEGMKLRLG